MAIRRLFVANRGEIALRIVRAAQALGIETVVAVSDADRDSAAARLADRAVVLGPAQAARSYLDPRLVVHAAKASGCDGLHPGYGFLSERAILPRLCAENGIAFVGPEPDVIDSLGDKIQARAMARAAGVPLVPGCDGVATAADARREGDRIGYPVLLKAAAGGGGRGMVIAYNGDEAEAGFHRASAEAVAAFGDGTLFMERFVPQARHVEVQLMGDGKGGVVHFGERDCSVQRRYQKLIEEAPCVAMPDHLRQQLHESACALAASVNYRNAGTCEFLYDVAREEFYFIEVNARIQVEHPVSEMIAGFDLVQEQLRIAGGSPLSVSQDQVRLTGHAIECRINAEDTARDFMPSPGRITRWSPPTGEGVRLDSHMSEGAMIPPYYDSMIGKLIVHAPTRDLAIDRLDAALAEFRVEGIATTIGLHREIIAHPDFRANRIHTRWLEQVLLAERKGAAA
ncbi:MULTISPECIES: acetyl/propionyl/methylcrotonyl-CoA carboxylase subunit alpha [unclassified Novosphingobium]|uniref:acetyl-CoA carboxylase biotin carboxylase subunit n=1 Tax=unclassified Novosphingobium TaxID=2644732 RepID=UPI001494391A|nr:MULTISPECIES: acetyl-CoA carboxylase biotin carboxylase subunit [unclassified Novosphingobium]MBB3359984.1 acetyl-CoA carboxylase biotin carboxylase subunit [Novosphingobium sp. BK256]MBB3376343.1 acetyl-CoA carboxylase biotin carboxylase subunit [Novosphingobium sp. BK280]MBB3380776.1 acetyl-CoA carboxylase biotin carboxylase subunit [Novosphingobium sp. BK258]MBB3422408.1 acetyl-CoA carboxylase biotin carboxylase subunit [Novosphingobium sp. BK267]MBB3451127.1 acetyl-CoA carboxylase bioti